MSDDPLDGKPEKRRPVKKRGARVPRGQKLGALWTGDIRRAAAAPPGDPSTVGELAIADTAPEKREPSKIVGVDDYGNRVGEDHPRAKLTDHEVELIRELHEGGMGVSEIARKFEMSKGAISMIVNYQRRATAPVGWRRVKLTAGAARIVEKHLK